MALLGLALLLIIVYIYNSRVFIYALMVFFVLFDMIDGFYEDQQIFTAFRYIVPLLLCVAFIIKNSALKKADIGLIILLLYLLILLPFSNGDILISLRTLFALSITFLLIPIGRSLGKRADIISEFEKFNRFLLIILPIYVIIANIFKFGESYSEAFTTGFLVTSRMYVTPIIMFLAIHYLITNKKSSAWLKGIDIVFIILNMGVLIINTRRTALAMIALALVIYTILNRRLILKMAIFILFLFTALMLSYPLYDEMLTTQLEKRARIQDLETYDEEGRYLEAFYIYDYHTRKQSLSEVLFGSSLFDTTDFGGRYFGRDRAIHSDINMVFYSTGIVGILLFGILFYQYFFLRNTKINKGHKVLYFPILMMFLIVLLPGRFIGTMTFAPLLMFLLAGTKASGLKDPNDISEENHQIELNH